MELTSKEDLSQLVQKRGFRKQAQKALTLAYDLMQCPEGRRQVHSKELYKAVGRPDREFGAYFLTFFERSGSYIVGEQSFNWSVRPERLSRLEGHARDKHTILEFAAACQANGRSFLVPPPPRGELPRTGDRVYPWWTMMKREWRERLFIEEHGVMWDYDIANAKPTLLLQVYDKFKGPREGLVPTWRRYVADKHGVRAELMRDLNWSNEKAKTVLQSVCNGAWVGRLRGALENEREFGEHPIYLGLREDYQRMWNVFKQFKHDGESQGQALSRIYNLFENTVMSVIEEELKEPVWWVHDGWLMRTEIEDSVLKELEVSVRRKTNLVISIDKDKRS